MISAHIYYGKKATFQQRIISEAPRVGDELRINNKFYIVDKIIWCFDEPPTPVWIHGDITLKATRVNIGAKKEAKL